jgi:hypothetical protein
VGERTATLAPIFAPTQRHAPIPIPLPKAQTSKPSAHNTVSAANTVSEPAEPIDLTPEELSTPSATQVSSSRGAMTESPMIAYAPREKGGPASSRKRLAGGGLPDADSPLAKRPKAHNTAQPHFVLPLAERLRPQRLEDVVGHHDIVGDSSPMHRLIKEARMGSVILWGPPG